MTSNNIRHVEEHGPTPIDELPFDVHKGDRWDGLHSFQLSGTSGTISLPQHQTRIYYVEGQARPRIVQTYLDANPAVVENLTRQNFRRLLRRHGRSWVESSEPVIDDYFDDPAPSHGGSTAGETQTCPFCATEVCKGGLPSHLEKDCGES